MSLENLDDFFNVYEFAKAVQVGAVGHEVEILGIFDNATVVVEDPPFGGVTTTKPKLLCKSVDVDALDSLDRVVIDSVAYRVTDVQPDGTGLTEVWLQKA